jgi:hypothetical protein
MRHALKLFAFLILPTQGVSALAGSPAEIPLKSSAGLVWIQCDKCASRKTVEYVEAAKWRRKAPDQGVSSLK